ncbi:hypothetical protein D0T87_04435 [Bacteroides sp. 51]|nr:hypothetical protein [Bacteroides sp. 51]
MFVNSLLNRRVSQISAELLFLIYFSALICETLRFNNFNKETLNFKAKQYFNSVSLEPERK